MTQGGPGVTDSLIGALNKARIASENHGFIRWITECVGATRYVVNDTVDKPHVIATWGNGARNLHIYYGYTTGFASKEEIIELLGNRAEPQHSKAGWWVPHPENRIYDGSERAKNKGREAGFCGCGMQLSLTGECSSCD